MKAGGDFQPFPLTSATPPHPQVASHDIPAGPSPPATAFWRYHWAAAQSGEAGKLCSTDKHALQKWNI